MMDGIVAESPSSTDEPATQTAQIQIQVVSAFYVQ